jgi:hypothetical protein
MVGLSSCEDFWERSIIFDGIGVSAGGWSSVISCLTATGGGCEVVRGGMTARVLVVDNFLSAIDFGAG